MTIVAPDPSAATRSARTPWRVLFLMQRPESWLNVHGIWREMRRDPRFEPVVWIISSAGDHAERKALRARCLETLAQHGIDSVQNDRDADPVLPVNEFAAAIFNAPYDRERAEAFHFDRVAASVGATIYVPYGLVMGAGWKNQRFQYAQATQIGADMIVARSSFERDLYARHCPAGSQHVVVTGLPRLDELYDLETFEVDSTLEAQIDGRFAILWNSHFSFGMRQARDANYSTFDTMARAFFAFAKERPDVALIWRPHPALFRSLVDEGIFRPDELDAFRAEVLAAGVILDQRPDHRHAFAASSMLMTDLGSFLVEYLATGRPIVYLENPEGEGLNDEGRALIQYIDVARTPEHALHLATAYAAGNDPKAPMRAVARDRFLPMLDGRASRRVVDAIAAKLAPDGDCRSAIGSSSLIDRMTDHLDRIAAQKRSWSGDRKALSRALDHVWRHLVEAVKQRPGLLRIVQKLRSKKH